MLNFEIMISYEEALRIARTKISDDSGLVEEDTLEKPYGWYFRAQSKRWLETRAFEDLLVGSGGFLVERETGHIIEFGSTRSIESHFEHYEAGLRYEFYIMTVLAVHNVKNAFLALQHLRLIDLRGMDFRQGIFSVEPTSKGKDFFEKMLQSLPFTFPVQHYYFQHDVLLEIKRAGWFEYDLLGVPRDRLESVPEPIYNGLLPPFIPEESYGGK
jgi:Immunity protein 35